MCCWNTLPGPSLSSETYKACQNIAMRVAFLTYNKVVACSCEPLVEAELRKGMSVV